VQSLRRIEKSNAATRRSPQRLIVRKGSTPIQQPDHPRTSRICNTGPRFARDPAEPAPALRWTSWANRKYSPSRQAGEGQMCLCAAFHPRAWQRRTKVSPSHAVGRVQLAAWSIRANDEVTVSRRSRALDHFEIGREKSKKEGKGKELTGRWRMVRCVPTGRSFDVNSL